MNGLLIGRFQPFHLGHLDAFQFALTQVDKLYIGIGSSNKPLTEQNPFNAEERKEMILSSLSDSLKNKIEIHSIPDFDDHQKWIENIDLTLPEFEVIFTNDEYTRDLYSQKGKKAISVPFKERETLSGTNIRKLILQNDNWIELVPEGTRNVLQKINARDRLSHL